MLERGFLSRVLFPAPVPSYSANSFPRELIWVPRGAGSGTSPPAASDTDSVPCLLLTYPSARFLVIFFHSNAEDLGRCRGFCCYVREQFQVHVLAVEYPGYGICPGIPTGESVMENAFAALRFAREALNWPLDSIKIFGRSIGTGPAVGLGSCFTFAGIILVTPFLSVQELFRDRVGPLAGLVEEWFSNENGAARISSPTMIIHGQRDELIACRHGESLFKLLKCRKLMVSPPDMEHNTNLLTNLQTFVLPMFQFFALPDYVFQDIKVPAWAYDKSRSPSPSPSHHVEFEACGQEPSQLPLPQQTRPRAASAPRKRIADYATLPKPGTRPRALSAVPARASPRKLLTPSNDRPLITAVREQQWQDDAGLLGPRPCLTPLLSLRATGGAPVDDGSPSEEEAGTCTRNLATALMPEDPLEQSGLELDTALGARPVPLQRSPSLAGGREDPIGSALASDGPCTGVAQNEPSACTVTSANTDQISGNDAAANGSASGPASSAEDKEEVIRKLTEFAGAMCVGELCSDRLVEQSETEVDRGPPQLAMHASPFESAAEQGQQAAEPAGRPRHVHRPGTGCPEGTARRDCNAAGPRPVQARASTKEDGLRGAEASIWTHWCGRSLPNVDLHEAGDVPQPQCQRWGAHSRRPQRPPAPQVPAGLGECNQLGFCRRGPPQLMSACCRGLPAEVASDLLSPTANRSAALPTDEELLEHLGPAAFLLPRHRRLSI